VTTTRFAPSPTGRLHLGHAYAALYAAAAGDRMLLRIEDLDAGRSDPAYDAAILDDLRWLGVAWDGPILRQSARAAAYRGALDALRSAGVVYPCFCSRGDVRRELDAMFGAPHLAPQGPDGPLYPGTCRAPSAPQAARRMAAWAACAWRLDVAEAAARGRGGAGGRRRAAGGGRCGGGAAGGRRCARWGGGVPAAWGTGG